MTTATNVAVSVASARCSAANSVAFAFVFAFVFVFAPVFALVFAFALVIFACLGLRMLWPGGRRWRGYAGGDTYGRGWDRRRRLSGRRHLGRIHANRLCEQYSVGLHDAADMR